MRWGQFFKGRMQSLTAAISRFSLSTIFLLIATLIIALNIQTEEFEYFEVMLACFVGALGAAVAQVMFERFFRDKVTLRYAILSPAILLAVLFYVVIEVETDIFSLEVSIRTIVLAFALLIAFIWIPSIRNKIAFSDSFTATFKSLFTTILFSIVLGIGIMSILSAINVLLIEVDYRFFAHAANIVASLFAPIFFLSYIPLYPLPDGKDAPRESYAPEVEAAISVPRTLEVLLSYIVIPVTMIFTVILTLYIVMNIGRDFWVDNLLEPMLVSYSIIVILVMLLVGRLDNKLVAGFRLIFPKVLFFIVLLQTVASIIQISEKGLTIGRYYVILFGIFAIISSIIFSIWPKQKNGLVAVVLIIFSVISIVPPVDAFTVSKNGQIAFLESVLSDNDMLSQNTIVPRDDLPADEQRKIAQTVLYLEQNGYTDQVDYLPEDYQSATDFQATFGFDQYNETVEQYDYYYFEWGNETILNVSDYQTMLKMQMDMGSSGFDAEFSQTVEINGESYQVELTEEGDTLLLNLSDENNQLLLSSDLSASFNEFDQASTTIEGNLTVEQAFIEEENDQASLGGLVMQMNTTNDGVDYIELFVFVTIK